jgi:hypothetical protein
MGTITLDTDQLLFSDPEWAVLVGGDYAADALVDVYRLSDPTQVVAYYAQFIANGTNP